MIFSLFKELKAGCGGSSGFFPTCRGTCGMKEWPSPILSLPSRGYPPPHTAQGGVHPIPAPPGEGPLASPRPKSGFPPHPGRRGPGALTGAAVGAAEAASLGSGGFISPGGAHLLTATAQCSDPPALRQCGTGRGRRRRAGGRRRRREEGEEGGEEGDGAGREGRWRDGRNGRVGDGGMGENGR